MKFRQQLSEVTSQYKDIENYILLKKAGDRTRESYMRASVLGSAPLSLAKEKLKNNNSCGYNNDILISDI